MRPELGEFIQRSWAGRPAIAPTCPGPSMILPDARSDARNERIMKGLVNCNFLPGSARRLELGTVSVTSACAEKKERSGLQSACDELIDKGGAMRWASAERVASNFAVHQRLRAIFKTRRRRVSC